MIGKSITLAAVACWATLNATPGADATPGTLSKTRAAHALALAQRVHASMDRRAPAETQSPCPQGGVAEAPHPLEAEVLTQNQRDVVTTYRACAIDGAVLQGSIINNWTITYDAASRVSSRVRTIKGTLRYDGDIEGTCVVDARLTRRQGVAGAIDDDETAFKGTFCGWPIAELEAMTR